MFEEPSTLTVSGLLDYAIGIWTSPDFAVQILLAYLIVIEVSHLQKKEVEFSGKIIAALIALFYVQYFILLVIVNFVWIAHEEIFFLATYWHEVITGVWSYTIYFGIIPQARGILGKSRD